MATSPSPRLVRRYGVDAARVLATARAVTGLADDELLRPVAEGVAVTLAELVFGVTDEGAHDVDDLLERRTRVAMVPGDRTLSEPAAASALAMVRSANVK
jgi:glycerol-3-phosphate dehydrogenase